MNVGELLVKECLNAAGAATGFGNPDTPCERRHEANRNMTRFAWANVIWWPLMLVTPDAGFLEWCEPDPHAAIRIAVTNAAAARRNVEGDLNMPQVVARRRSQERYRDGDRCL